MTTPNTPEENRAQMDRAKNPPSPFRQFGDRDTRSSAEKRLDEQKIIPHHSRTVRA